MKKWTYEKAGVPHLKGDPSFNRKIVRLIGSTRTSGVLGNPTGFAAFFDPQKTGLRDPLLVASTDGVGTKLEIAKLQGRHNTIGIDLVAMCVNDVITCGARPVFFLDYFASGKFNPRITQEVLQGITAGCRQAGCALIGGETAIMPGFYGADKYDLAGFSVGLVERKRVIDGRQIRPGDQILGLAASGFHSNGYSLLRKLFSTKELRGRIGRELLTPTRIYVRPVLDLLRTVRVLGIANITGGGFIDNLPRILPRGLGAAILSGTWRRPKLFDLVRDSGNISSFEMFRTFNAGIGMVLVLKKQDAHRAQKRLRQMNLSSWVIGEIIKGQGVEVL